MPNYAALSRPTQTQAAKPNQVKNNAGGFVFQLEPLKQLERFLILGSDRPTYYATARALTVENAGVVVQCWRDNPQKTLDLIVEISHEGRAPKNDPAIFAMALGTLDDQITTRQLVYANIHRVCRTATHLFQFIELTTTLGKGFGRGLKRAVSRFYTERNLDGLALQVIKYRTRNRYTHKRVLQLSHPKTADKQRANLFSYIVGKEHDTDALPGVVKGFQLAQSSPKEALKLYPELPWEAYPTEFLNDPDLWKTILPSMGLTALMRNLGKMSSCGVLKQFSDEEDLVVNRLTDAELIKTSRLHPFNILVAKKTYGSGCGFRGSNTWPVNSHVLDALERAFYLAFDNVTPAGKRTFIGLDVSGSMNSPIAGTNVTCREAAAAMAMVTLRSEPKTHIMGFAHNFVDLGIRSSDSLEAVLKKAYSARFGSTDCSLPMLYALEQGLQVDQFVIYTDNETYYGRVHPFQALKNYRRSSGINAKLAVVGMTATNFSISDPSDLGMLDVVGFDTAAPALIANF